VLPRLSMRTASFCSFRAGHYEADGWDQGLSFALPNMTWLQPPAYVHTMVHRTWLPFGLAATTTGTACNWHWGQRRRECASVSAQGAFGRAGASSVVVRFVNDGNAARTVTIRLHGVRLPAKGHLHATVLQLNATHMAAVNTPAAPEAVSPREWTWRGFANGSSLVVPAYSYTAITVVVVEGDEGGG